MHRILGVTMSQDERAEYNRLCDLPNAAAALGPAGFRRVFDDAMSEEEMDAVLSYGSAPTAGRSATSDDQGPSCPRRGWKVLGSRFRFAAPLPVAA